MRRSNAWGVALVALAVGLGCSERGMTGSDPGPDGLVREQTLHLALRLRAPDVGAAADRLRDVVAVHGGYVETGRERPSASDASATFELRVPADALPALRSELRGLGEVADENEEATDVTAEHVDLSTRIHSVHAEQERLVEMMAVRTDELADVLAVERELARVSESLEQLEASERSLAARVAMARVTVEIAPLVPDFTDDPVGRVVSAASTGLSVARGLALVMAMSVAALAPSIAVLVALAFSVRRISRALISLASRHGQR